MEAGKFTLCKCKAANMGDNCDFLVVEQPVYKTH